MGEPPRKKQIRLLLDAELFHLENPFDFIQLLNHVVYVTNGKKPGSWEQRPAAK